MANKTELCIFQKGVYCFWLQHYIKKKPIIFVQNSQQIMSHATEFCNFLEKYFLTVMYLWVTLKFCWNWFV